MANVNVLGNDSSNKNSNNRKDDNKHETSSHEGITELLMRASNLLSDTYMATTTPKFDRLQTYPERLSFVSKIHIKVVTPPRIFTFI